MKDLPWFMLERIQVKENGCWEWTGKKMCESFNGGYGRISIDGKHYTVHRLAYMLAIGEIADGLLVCHKCDNPPCCNPEHLFLGTPEDNMNDCVTKGRLEGRKGVGAKKLKPYWKDICDKFSLGATLKALAKEYGTSPQTIKFIVYGYVNRMPSAM